MTHEFRQPHAPARDAALKRIAGRAEELVDWAVQTAIAGALQAPLAVPGVGALRVVHHAAYVPVGLDRGRMADHAPAIAALAALDADAAPPVVALASGGTRTLRGPAERRALAGAWARRLDRVHTRAHLWAAARLAEFRDLAGGAAVQVDDPGADVLADLDRREALWRDMESKWFRGAADRLRALLDDDYLDPASDPDAEALRRLDDAAREQAGWLLDGGSRPASAAQEIGRAHV